MKRCPEIEELTRQLYHAVSSAQLTFFEERVSRADGIVFTGTEAQEWWEDRRSLMDAMRAQMSAAGPGTLTLMAGDVRAYSEGDVAWVADRPTIDLGGMVVACRHTSVFVREAGEWRIVQHHFSIGVPNEVAFGSGAGRLASPP